MENVQELLQLMARLRDPLHGCPWDLRQDFKSLAPYCLEEAHEVVDAIERGDSDHLREELGDLLLQVVFLARIAEEQGLFDFAAVVETLKAKLTRRHPHVFGERRFASEAAFKAFWEDTKTEEQKARHPGGKKGLLDGIARTLPALSRAQKIQSKAARVGFDWPSVAPVYAKLEEELEELREAGLTHAGLSTRRAHAWQMLFLWPFFLLGFAFWFLPCYLPYLLCKKMNIYPGYDSNIKMLAGLFTFPLALWGGWALVYALSNHSWMAWLSLPAWVALGYLAEYYMDRWALWREVQKAREYERGCIALQAILEKLSGSATK